jgi:hypothetical protein
MLKMKRSWAYQHFQQYADNPKVTALNLDGKNRNGTGLEPKVKIVSHL